MNLPEWTNTCPFWRIGYYGYGFSDGAGYGDGYGFGCGFGYGYLNEKDIV